MSSTKHTQALVTQRAQVTTTGAFMTRYKRLFQNLLLMIAVQYAKTETLCPHLHVCSYHTGRLVQCKQHNNADSGCAHQQCLPGVAAYAFETSPLPACVAGEEAELTHRCAA
jgi:hypothetical protein